MPVVQSYCTGTRNLPVCNSWDKKTKYWMNWRKDVKKRRTNSTLRREDLPAAVRNKNSHSDRQTDRMTVNCVRSQCKYLSLAKICVYIYTQKKIFLRICVLRICQHSTLLPSYDEIWEPLLDTVPVIFYRLYVRIDRFVVLGDLEAPIQQKSSGHQAWSIEWPVILGV